METSLNQENSVLNWVQHFDFETIKSELELLLCKKSSSNEVLQKIGAEARLQFLIALALNHLCPNLAVTPSNPINSNGVTKSTSNKNDKSNDRKLVLDDTEIMIEISLLVNKERHLLEIWRAYTQLEDLLKTMNKSIRCIVVPSIHTLSNKQIHSAKKQYGLTIIQITMSDSNKNITDKDYLSNLNSIQ